VDLLTNVAALENEKKEIAARLQSLREGKAKMVTKEQREEVEKEWARVCRVARKREAVAKGMWGFIEDRVEGREAREEVREMLGLDD
jgi:26S proteasome regulatory subunit (ATPase 3-interacting protein)